MADAGDNALSTAVNVKVEYTPHILLHLLEASERITGVRDLIKNLAEYTKEDESTFKSATVSAYKRRLQMYAKTAARYKYMDRLSDLDEHWKSDFRTALWTEQDKQRIIDCGTRLPRDENDVDEDGAAARRSIAPPPQPLPSVKRMRQSTSGIRTTGQVGEEEEEEALLDSAAMPLLRKLAGKFDRVLTKLEAAEKQVNELQHKVTELETNSLFMYGYIKGLEYRRS